MGVLFVSGVLCWYACHVLGLGCQMDVKDVLPTDLNLCRIISCYVTREYELTKLAIEPYTLPHLFSKG